MNKYEFFNDDFLGIIRKDLKDLFENDEITQAKTMKGEFATKQLPMFFTGKFDAKTVFVMLNPGSKIEKGFSFKGECIKKYTDFEDFFEKYMDNHINWGSNYSTIDNFDLKQAAFLSGFEQSGIDLSSGFIDSEKKEDKIEAQKNVLMQKLQLELIPYCSAKFEGVLDNFTQAKENFELFKPHLERVLNAIVSYDRKYVIFGSRQFEYLLKAYKKKLQNTEIEFVCACKKDIENLRNSVSFSVVKIKHQNKIFHALIANTFPRQDLPNAYKQMSEYGKVCWEAISKYLQ
jgi:hypothetical protein